MHVVYDYQIFGAQLFGGISRYFCALARELESLLDLPPRIIAPTYRNVLLQDVPARLVTGMHVPPLPRTERAARLVNRALFPLLARRWRPDIVHETYYSDRPSYPFDAARVLTVFDMIHERFANDDVADDGTAEAKATAVRRADRVICISNQTRDDLLARHDLPPDRVRVVHLGFDRLDARGATATDLVGERPYLLYVGARSGYKNFARLVEAYAASPMLRANARIVCFGGSALSPREQELLASVGVAGDVVATSGGDAELAALYAGALAFVYPSLYEGFGIPPLEAMSLGCPVACSAGGSIPEVVGDAAERFDATDPASIRRALELLAVSPRRREELRNAGRARASLFSWSRCAQETLAVYRELVPMEGRRDA